MSVDIARLVFEFDSSGALTAEKAIDRATAAAERWDTTTRKTKTATQLAGIEMGKAAEAGRNAARSATDLASAEGAVERATRATAKASSEVTAQRRLQAAAMAELVRATKDYERDLKAAAQIEADAATAAEKSASDLLAFRMRMNKQRAAEEAATAKIAQEAQEVADRAAEKSAAQVLAFRVRIAKQRASEEAAEVGQAAAAQAAADREAERSAEQLFGLRMRLTKQRALQEAADIKATADAERDLARAMATLKASVDPVGSSIDRVNAELEEATRLYKLGAISANQYGEAFRVLDGRLSGLRTGHAEGARSAKLQAHELANLSFQLQDVIVSLASGQKPMMVAVQQGSQIGQVFQGAAARGVTLKEAVLGLAASAGRFLLAWAPVIGVVGAIVGAFLLWRKHLDDVKAATKATAEATKNFAEVQASTRDALGSAVEFAEKYAVANAGVAKSLDGVLASQSAAYKETMAGIGATDAAGQAAVRRAELERLATVAILKRAAAEATARAADSDAAVKKAKGAAQGAGLWVAFGLAGSPDMISAAQQAEAAKFKKIGGDAAQKAAAQEREYAKTLNASADALMNAKLIIPPATKAVASHGAAVKAAATDTDDFDRSLRQLLESLETASERVIRETAESTMLLGKGLATGKISAEQYREAVDRLFPVVVDVKDAQKAWNGELVNTPADIKGADRAVMTLEDHVRNLADAFDDVSYSFGGIVRAFKTGNFGRLIDDVLTLKDGLGALLSSGAGGVASAGSAIATAIGGKGGRAVGGGLGLAAAGLSAGAFAGTAAGAAALATAGIGAGAIASMAALAGPIGIAAGALYAAAKLFNVGGKASNAGAGYDLRTGAVSGKSRTEETEGAARAAGDAIQGIMDAVKAAGIGVTDAVTGLVLGTRDVTQIYLASGKTLTSAVGDSGAAVDTAMRALLSSATYVSDAQKKLVDSAIAAGKGFDAVAEILAKYEAAQGISGALADQIQQLTNPQAFDTEAVKRDIEAQRKAYQQLATDGFLTADMLATINGQLTTLEGLKLDEVLKRYADGAASSPGEDQAAAIDKARSDVLEAYDTFSSAKKAEIDALRQSEAGLKAFRRELDFGAIAGRDPISQLAATRREFDRLNAMDAANPERVANLQSVSQAFIEASKAASPTQLAFQRDIASVRRATEASQQAVGDQADIAQMQLDAQTAQLTALGLLNTTTLDLATTLKAYLALTAQGGAANDNAFDVNRYLANNPDLAANWNAGGSLRGAGGSLEEAARAHWATTGHTEVAQGLRAYAAGGSHPGGLRLVGEEGPEIEATGPSRIYSARDTARMMGGDTSRLEALIERQTEVINAQAGELRRISANTDQTQNQLKKMDGNGLYVRGRAPDEPIITEAA